MPDSSDGPTVLRILLGSHLRRLREARGITARQAASKIRTSESKISRIELGRNAIREIDVLDLLTLYGVDAREREQFLTLAEQSNRPGWWHRYNDILPDWFQAYVGMEDAARSIRVYEAQFIPGLLQTEDYATAVISLGDHPIDQAERLVMFRKERQRRFRDGKLKLWGVLDEAVLRQPVAGIAVQIEQLRYLQKACASPTLTLQVIPYGAGGRAVPTGFSILQFAERDLPDVVYVENLTSALYLDKQADVDRYLLAMERLSIVAYEPYETPRILDEIIKHLESEALLDQIVLGTQALSPSHPQTRETTPRNDQRNPAFSDGGAHSELKTPTHDSLFDASPSGEESTLSVTIYLSDEVIHDQVEAAVDNWLADANLVVEERDEPIIGSWFRRVRVGIKRAVRTPAARDALLTAAHAVDTRMVLAQDATVTATLLQGVAPVIASLQPTKDAIVRAGAVLIVKIDWGVQVYQLTAAQQLMLNHQPQLLSSPTEIIAALHHNNLNGNGGASEIEQLDS